MSDQSQSKFRVGDKVISTSAKHPGHVAEVTEVIYNSQFELNPFFYKLSPTIGGYSAVSERVLELESVYNSPLYKALKES